MLHMATAGMCFTDKGSGDYQHSNHRCEKLFYGFDYFFNVFLTVFYVLVAKVFNSTKPAKLLHKTTFK